MLTEIQINQLTSLKSEYPEYAHLIPRMIEGWKITDPSPKFYGITWTDEPSVIPDSRKCTCLIGSCILGMTIPNSQEPYWEQLFVQLNISTSDRWSIVYGFDGEAAETAASEKAWKFGQRVREIVL